MEEPRAGFDLAYNSVYEYDPVADTWDTTKTPMPTARFNHSSAVVDGKIYVFGGATNNTLSPISSVEVYDPVSDSWDTTKTPMPIAKCLHTSSASNGKIYIFTELPDSQFSITLLKNMTLSRINGQQKLQYLRPGGVQGLALLEKIFM